MLDMQKDRFIELLLSLLIIFFAILALHAYHHGISESGFVTFCTDNGKQLVAALLTITVARTAGNRKSDSNGGNNVPSKPIDNPTDVPRVGSGSVPTT
jgi:hypothetical protein